MVNRVDEIKKEIHYFKQELAALWQLKGKTDQEVLDMAEKLDKLMNEYDYLQKYSVNHYLDNL